jgi:hypothetical protein
VLVVLSILAPATSPRSYDLALATAEESDLALTRPGVAASVQMMLPAALRAIRSVVQFPVFLIASVVVRLSDPSTPGRSPDWGAHEPFPPVGQRRRALLQVYRI